MRRWHWLCILAAVFCIGWRVLGLPWGLVAALVVFALFQCLEGLRFHAWTKHPLRRPQDDWTWRSGAERLHKLIRATRTRSEQLVATLRRMQRTADSIPDGLVVLHTSGEIEYHNLAARTLLGLLPSDRGKNLFAFVRYPDAHPLISGEDSGELVEIPSPVDPSKQIEMRRVELDEDRYIVIARDVTERNRLLTLRREFVANVSHELRTPLTVMIGYLEALDDPHLDEDARRGILAKLVRPAERMHALSEDLLKLTDLESSPSPEESKVVGVVVSRILETVVEEARNLSKGQHELLLDADDSLIIEGDPEELFSAFHNLVINAVRYSPDGGRIRVRWYRSGESAVFEVRDQGVGIAAEHLSRLTERFYRVDLHAAGVRGGTGLGLAIVKHVLKRHNTWLQIESQLGKGSRFSCVFPELVAFRSE